MPINQHQPDYHPSRFDSKIPGIVPRQQINMEGTHHQKKETTYLKTREMNWLIGKNSPLSLENKLLIYKTVLKPIWTYGIMLWGCASKSNISVIQRYQSKLLRTITNAPWYVTNQTLHPDLRIPYVHSVLQDYIHKTSISTRSPFQPPRGTFAPHNTHQETEKTLDIRCDKLRCGQWTNTWSNDTTNSALA